MIDAVGLRVVLVALAGWVNRHQLEVIEYLREENRILKEHLDGVMSNNSIEVSEMPGLRVH